MLAICIYLFFLEFLFITVSLILLISIVYEVYFNFIKSYILAIESLSQIWIESISSSLWMSLHHPWWYLLWSEFYVEAQIIFIFFNRYCFIYHHVVNLWLHQKVEDIFLCCLLEVLWLTFHIDICDKSQIDFVMWGEGRLRFIVTFIEISN